MSVWLKTAQYLPDPKEFRGTAHRNCCEKRFCCLTSVNFETEVVLATIIHAYLGY
jgi:hypothetical protein